MIDPRLLDIGLLVAGAVLLILVEYKVLEAVRRWRTSGSYQGRVSVIGRIADKIPSLDGDKANMVAYHITLTNKYDGDVFLRLYKRDNPLWGAFEGGGAGDVWIIEARRVKRRRRRVISMAHIHEGLFHEGDKPRGPFEGPFGG